MTLYRLFQTWKSRIPGIVCCLIWMATAGTVSAGHNPEDSLSSAQSVTPNPFELGDIRPRFFEIGFRTLPAVQSYPYTERRDVQEFGSNKLINAQLSLPVVYKPGIKLLAQLRYKREWLNLGKIEGVYDRDLSLQNTGLNLLYKIRLNEGLFLAGHLGGSLKADSYQYQFYGSIFDFNSSVIVAREIDGRGQRMGFGVVFGNSLGRFNILPLIVYDKMLSPRWTLEMRLPKEIFFRRILKPDSFYLLFGAEANGAAYYLSEKVYPELDGVEFRRTAIEFNVGLEKEIHDWLWIGCQAGFTQPLRSALVLPGRPSRYAVHNFQHHFTPYASVSLFAVPPRKLMKR